MTGFGSLDLPESRIDRRAFRDDSGYFFTQVSRCLRKKGHGNCGRSVTAGSLLPEFWLLEASTLPG
jgi:hypothetical protein